MLNHNANLLNKFMHYLLTWDLLGILSLHLGASHVLSPVTINSAIIMLLLKHYDDQIPDEQF